MKPAALPADVLSMEGRLAASERGLAGGEARQHQGGYMHARLNCEDWYTRACDILPAVILHTEACLVILEAACNTITETMKDVRGTP